MFLTLLPVWLSGLILVGVPTLLAVGAQVLLRRRLGLERLRSNNEVAGFKFAAVGVLYAVLLAFAVIVVWERFQRCREQGIGGSQRGSHDLPLG